MREFFRGWRRKVGCITLVLAVVTAGVWFRSLFYGEYVSMNSVVIISQQGELSYDFTSGNNGWHWGSINLSRPTNGFVRYNHSSSVWEYWHISVPLTLLSAYLILWKPRVKSKDKPIER